MWPNPQIPVALVTFTKETFNGKLHFLCSSNNYIQKCISGLIQASKMERFAAIVKGFYI